MLRILYNSRSSEFKTPFGTVQKGEMCTIQIKIPISCQTRHAVLRIMEEDGKPFMEIPMEKTDTASPYEIWKCSFCLDTPNLYFYFFQITTPNESFRLLRQGEDTNMEAGDWWQLSCIAPEAAVPQWSKGAVMYQIFPDRFARSGRCDLRGKLQPYVLHEQWDEEVFWQPTEKGEVLNNDFYGGNFRGITEKLDYLSALGVSILYLNPIGKAFSSHRYDTGDYLTPDPMLGTEADFSELCQQAHLRGIRIVLDGVYSHTGSDSLYFDRKGSFGGKGAYCDPESPYRSWYRFRSWPDSYESWWNFDTLPCLDKTCPAVMDYIIDNADSVVAHWLALGADGFRLDVVDELPDSFVLRLKQRIRQIKPDALLIGEVWEDASNKIAYDHRRRYFVDGELDGVMNYPYRTAILRFARQQDDGQIFRETVMRIAENYPPDVLACSMLPLGTHDTPRILTALVDDFDGDRAEAAARHLSVQQIVAAKERLRLASFLQFMLPGAPCIYYGDEAGMEGHKDPFNRRTFPWGKEDTELQDHYARLGKLRRENPALQSGLIRFFAAGQGRLGFRRKQENGTQELEIYVNQSPVRWDIPAGKLLLGYKLEMAAQDGLMLQPGGFCAIQR